ncbi:MAG TPA: glycosyltransferase [Thermoplasmata archaeon]|nr:glycosyltransferase [Thermoplasmata archaeon]
MRILHLIESHTVHTDRILRHQLAEGNHAAVVTFHDHVGHGPVTVLPGGGLYARLPYRHHWQGLTGVLRVVRRFQPDILHGHYLSTAAAYLSCTQGPATVGTAMGSDILFDSLTVHARLLLRSLRWTVDRFTSVAPHLTRRMVELGLPSEHISTFPWGVDVARFRPSPEPSSDDVIISTRNFEPVYDLPTLLRAFGRVSRNKPDVRLELLGDGSQRAFLASLAARIAPPGRIEFLGRIPPDTLADRLRSASLYISTSLSDGASTSLLEAMAVGLLPIVTDIQANQAWIRDGRNGLLFAAGDEKALAGAILHGLEDKGLRDRARRENPLIIAARASWRTSMDRLDAVYRAALV